MAKVAYELQLADASLPSSESDALHQVELIKQVVREHGGTAVDAWAFHFDTLEAAQATGHELRQKGVVSTEAQIRTVDAHTGSELPS
jgi:hypothetical protein